MNLRIVKCQSTYPWTKQIRHMLHNRRDKFTSLCKDEDSTYFTIVKISIAQLTQNLYNRHRRCRFKFFHP